MSIIQLVCCFIRITSYAFATVDSVFSTDITLFKITAVKAVQYNFVGLIFYVTRVLSLPELFVRSGQNIVGREANKL